MYKQIIIIPILFLGIKAYGQLEKIEPDWVQSDSVFISRTIKTYQQEPKKLFKLLSDKTNKKTNLGFDYILVEGSNGRGYVSFFYEFILLRDKVVGYKIDAQMPHDLRLIPKYKKFYSPLFKFENDRPETLYFGYEEMTRPTQDIDIYSANKYIQFFMTPFCGIMYGDYGDDPMTILPNRKLYNSVKNVITPKICRLLLFSKNPATRLYAIEYYYQNADQFKKDKTVLEEIISNIFKEKPVIETMSADLILLEDAKHLVEKLSKIK